MRQASKRIPESAEKTVRDIRRATRRHHSAEEKIRIVRIGRRYSPGAIAIFDRFWSTAKRAVDVRAAIAAPISCAKMKAGT
jgi:hypothetical protein